MCKFDSSKQGIESGNMSYFSCEVDTHIGVLDKRTNMMFFDILAV